MKPFSIGIITRNRKKMLRTCLASIYEKIREISMEVIVVDNNSKDGTPEMVQNEFANAQLIVNRVNKGVAKTRNQIIERYHGEYLLLIDDDIEIQSSNFRDLIVYMQNNKEVGIIGCRILTPDKQIYLSARTLPSLTNILAKRFYFLPFFNNNHLLDGYRHSLTQDTRPIVVDFVIGAFQLIRRDAQRKVGYLDGIMNYGFQDADFCARMKKSGFLTVYYPGFEIVHYKGIVSERMFSKYVFYYLRSYAWLYLKHHDLMRKNIN